MDREKIRVSAICHAHMTCDIELLEGVGLQNKHRQAKGHASFSLDSFKSLTARPAQFTIF